MACAAVIAVTLSGITTRIIFGRPTPIALDRRQSSAWMTGS